MAPCSACSSKRKTAQKKLATTSRSSGYSLKRPSTTRRSTGSRLTIKRSTRSIRK